MAFSGDRLARALLMQSDVDHHDGVLLHDADQHDDADDRDDIQVEAEELQRQQRAETGGGQAGEDCHRVDEALIQHSENHIDHENRGQQQDALALERILEDLRRALE